MNKRPTHTTLARICFPSIWSPIRSVINKCLIFWSIPAPQTNCFTAKCKAHLFSICSYKWKSLCIINHYFIFTAHHIFCWFNCINMFSLIYISITCCTIDHEFRIKARSAEILFFFFFNSYRWTKCYFFTCIYYFLFFGTYLLWRWRMLRGLLLLHLLLWLI